MRILEGEALLDDDYVKNFYDQSTALLNHGGMTLVHKKMFDWAQQLMAKVREHFSTQTLRTIGPRAIQRAFGAVIESEELLSAFTASVKTLPEFSANIRDDTIKLLHNELLRKVFHARVEVDVKTYKEEVTGKTGKNKNTSKVNFRVGLEVYEELAKAKKGRKRGGRKRGKNAVAAVAAEEDITRELFVEGNDDADEFYAAIDYDAIDLDCIVSSI
jgi:hypothetical protein